MIKNNATLEFISKVTNKSIEEINEIIKKEENDFNVMAMLIDFMNKISIIVSQMYTLKDKAEQMPTGWDNFDNHISEWGIKGLNLGE